MEEEIVGREDLSLTFLAKQDLSTLSIEDLEGRIEALRAEITRAQAAINDRGDTIAAAESLFKS